MSRRYEPDRRAFLDAAKKPGAKIWVTTDARVNPQVQGTAVVMQPAILLHYVLTFKEDEEEQKWIHEDLIDDKGGRLKIEGTLLEDISKDQELRKRLTMADRTM